MLVQSRMLYPETTIGPLSTVRMASEEFDKNENSCLPVVDRQMRLTGVISPCDIRSALDEGRLDEPVSQFMTTNVISLRESDTIEEAARIVTDYDLYALPVLRDGFLVGMVTRSLLIRVLMEVTGARRQGLRLMVEIPDEKGSLLELVKVIVDLGGSVQSIASFCAEDNDHTIITLRVQDADKFALKDAIRQSSFRLLDIR